jgi:hypothetical protein
VNAFFLLLALSIYMRDDCVVSSQITSRSINSKGFRAWYVFNHSRLYGYLVKLKNKLHANEITGHTAPRRVSVPYVLEARARRVSKLESENKQLKERLSAGGDGEGQSLKTNPVFLKMQTQVATLTKEKKLIEKKFEVTEKNYERTKKKLSKMEQQRQEDRNAIDLLLRTLGLPPRPSAERESEYEEDDEAQLSAPESKAESTPKPALKQSKNRYGLYHKQSSGSVSPDENSLEETLLTDENTSQEEPSIEVSCNV